MTDRQQFISELMATGVSNATARYRWKRYKKDVGYTPRPRRGVSKEELLELKVVIHKNITTESGFLVFQEGKRRPISVKITNMYKNTPCKYHYYTWIREKNGKQWAISLASLIMVLIKGEDIPAGYVVDHIDNDSFNNDLDNLQVITISENVKKNHRRHNQYNYNK